MAIEYGMTSDEFWKGNPDLLWSYRISFINKEKRKAEYDNYMSWLSGLYNFKGFRTVYSSAWSKNSKERYPNQPLNLFGEEKQKNNKLTKEQQHKKLQQQYEKDCIFFASMKQRFIEKLKEKGE